MHPSEIKTHEDVERYIDAHPEIKILYIGNDAWHTVWRTLSDRVHADGERFPGWSTPLAYKGVRVRIAGDFEFHLLHGTA